MRHLEIDLFGRRGVPNNGRSSAKRQTQLKPPARLAVVISSNLWYEYAEEAEASSRIVVT